MRYPVLIIILLYRGINESTTEGESIFDESSEDLDVIKSEKRILFQGRSPANEAGFFSKIFFFWVDPLIYVSIW